MCVDPVATVCLTNHCMSGCRQPSDVMISTEHNATTPLHSASASSTFGRRFMKEVVCAAGERPVV